MVGKDQCIVRCRVAAHRPDDKVNQRLTISHVDFTQIFD